MLHAHRAFRGQVEDGRPDHMRISLRSYKSMGTTLFIRYQVKDTPAILQAIVRMDRFQNHEHEVSKKQCLKRTARTVLSRWLQIASQVIGIARPHSPDYDTRINALIANSWLHRLYVGWSMSSESYLSWPCGLCRPLTDHWEQFPQDIEKNILIRNGENEDEQ